MVRLTTCWILTNALVCGQNATVLLNRMQAALGSLDKAKDLDWTVKATVWDGAGREAGYAIRRYRIVFRYVARKDQEMHVAENRVLHTRFYFDGKSGWGSFANMTALSDTPIKPLQGVELNMVRKEVLGFWLNLWRAQDREISSCGPHTLRLVDKGLTSDETDIEF